MTIKKVSSINKLEDLGAYPTFKILFLCATSKIPLNLPLEKGDFVM